MNEVKYYEEPKLKKGLSSLDRAYLLFYCGFMSGMSGLGFYWVTTKWLFNYPLLALIMTCAFVVAGFVSLLEYPTNKVLRRR